MLVIDSVQRGPVAVTDDVAEHIETLQFTLGEGPCLDAYRLDHPVLEEDLAEPSQARWTAFGPAAVDLGVRAIFGFPLTLGAVRIGSLNLYRNQPGPLSDDQHADALVAAEVVTGALLAMQAGAAPGSIAPELEEHADFGYAVHQAAGMVSVQLGTPVTEALLRLRAHAFLTERPVGDVAKDVISRRLRFDSTEPPSL